MNKILEIDEHFLRRGEEGRRALICRGLRLLGSRFARRVPDAKSRQLRETFARSRPAHIRERLGKG